MSLDFTLDKYTELCHTIQAVQAEVMTVGQFIKTGQPQHQVVILRHDVDRCLPYALRMAKLEAGLGIKATYYVRTTRAVFSPKALQHIHELGHEVGYHYETLARAKGNHRQAMLMFEQDLARFRQVVPVETISMHGSPLSPWDNRDLWRSYDFMKYDLLGEAYLSINYDHVYYFTDTGRSWDAGCYNMRDRVTSCRPAMRISTTDDLITFFRQHPAGPVLINTHPNRWATNRWEWTNSLVSDWIINQAKRLISQTNSSLFAYENGLVE